MKELTIDEKYRLYEDSVQSAPDDVKFISEKYQEIWKTKPKSLREDFCGTGWLCAEWVKKSKTHSATGIDLDPTPVEYGKRVHLKKLGEEQKGRVKFVIDNVLNIRKAKYDAIVAFNFSYSVFKTRDELRKYFESVRQSMSEKSVFFLDVMGGPDSQSEMTEKRKMDDYTYYWTCKEFSPVDHHCFFTISFKKKGKKKKYKDVFEYDWRLWTIPEIREIMQEAGFSKTQVYWEGDDGKGGGNGIFTLTDKGETCDCWIAYVAAMV